MRLITFDPLWETMRKKGVTTYTLITRYSFSKGTLDALKHNRSITLATLKAIYEGKIRNWKDVGGKDAPIVVVSRDSSSGTFETWEELVMKKARVTPRALLQTSNGTVVQTVAKNVNAIGYIGLGYVDGQTKSLTIAGTKATAQNAKTKTWPLSRELYFFTNGTPSGAAKSFTDFVLDPAKGQKLVKETGFVPLHE